MAVQSESDALGYGATARATASPPAPSPVLPESWDWFVGASAYRAPAWYRALEIVVAAAALLLAAPILLVFAIAVKLESPGPAFFVQTRMTTGCRRFRFFKLRTMHADWERRFPKLALADLRNQDPARIRLKTPDDPRVTPLGHFLRRTSIDELSNFWHVLTGDMTLVGPRPEIPELLPHYRGKMMEKFAVKPGITGYAQIHGRGDLTFLRTVQHDLRYVQERSLAVDLRVLWQTVASVLLGRGAY